MKTVTATNDTLANRLANLLGSRTRTARLYNKMFRRMSRGDGYQPFGYDMPTMWSTHPGWAVALVAVMKAHNSLPLAKEASK